MISAVIRAVINRVVFVTPTVAVDILVLEVAARAAYFRSVFGLLIPFGQNIRATFRTQQHIVASDGISIAIRTAYIFAVITHLKFHPTFGA